MSMSVRQKKLTKKSAVFIAGSRDDQRLYIRGGRLGC